MKEFQGVRYDEVIPEIKCLADRDGAQVFLLHDYLGWPMRILAYTEQQARDHLYQLEAEDLSSED
jgi:hypothetical protein